MPIRITGLNSGLDTEAIISALVSSYSYKTNKYKKAQTKLSWKQDAWKTLNTKVYSFYTSLDSLRFSKNYNLIPQKRRLQPAALRQMVHRNSTSLR